MCMKHLPLKIQRPGDYNVGVPEWVLLFASSQKHGIGSKGKKGENNMRKYKRNGQLETVMCNQCGKKLIVEEGIVREGVISIDHMWDFFSKKMGRSTIWICVKSVMMRCCHSFVCRLNWKNR